MQIWKAATFLSILSEHNTCSTAEAVAPSATVYCLGPPRSTGPRRGLHAMARAGRLWPTVDVETLNKGTKGGKKLEF
jgi:hypothetical protein